MIRRLIAWALDNPLVVLTLAVALIVYGAYSFYKVNVEAYPDPAPAIVEVIAQFPGASAEEVERQVTIPLEVTFGGMPKMTYLRSKSLFGLSHLRIQFEYGYDYWQARQEVINRLQFTQQLPPGVTPQLSPQSPTGEIFRYTVRGPKEKDGSDIYTLNDLKALQDWVLEREFRRVPRIMDITSRGGTVKRYEIHLDPNAMSARQITLQQVQNAILNANQNVGADFVIEGPVAANIRSIGLIGAGRDPVQKVLGMKDPNPQAAEELAMAEREPLPANLEQRKAHVARVIEMREEQRRRLARAAVKILREEENKRIMQIRKIVVITNNVAPIRIEDLVVGGRIRRGRPESVSPQWFSATLVGGGMATIGARIKPPDPGEPAEPIGEKGIVVGHQTRLGRSGLSIPNTAKASVIDRVVDTTGKILQRDEDDKVECVVLMRKGEDTLPALAAVRKKLAEFNDPNSGKLLPGVVLEPYYDRTDLINVTTETVQENLILGMVLVIMILLMFLSNVRGAIIVAINIPLALLFAFAMLYSRGKSANLLSIGAVDFGIIVDSSVIMIENIYRKLCAGENSELPLKERILHACLEVEKPLFFSTAIIICAFIPLFTMSGPEGQLFGPMADTYAFALGGALLLALTLSPVLAMLLFRNLKPGRDNALVNWLRRTYLQQLRFFLKHRWLTLAGFAFLIGITAVYALPRLGREFMPELEEGNLWIRGTFELSTSLENVSKDCRVARSIMGSYPEVQAIVAEIGRPDDGTDPTGFYNAEFFVPLRPEKEWPLVVKQEGWRRWIYGPMRRRTKAELISQMNADLERDVPGTDWNFSQNIRDNVMEALSGVKGDNSIKIFGPELKKLDELAKKVKNKLKNVRGIQNVGIFQIKGQTNIEFLIDLDKCEIYGVSAADVNNMLQSAVGAKAFSAMIEGERIFDISTRFHIDRRRTVDDILDLPVDLINLPIYQRSGPGKIPYAEGIGQTPPDPSGSQYDTSNPTNRTQRLRLRNLVIAIDENGDPAPKGRFARAGASTVYREQGTRMIAIKFSVRERDLASAVDEAKQKTKDLFDAPYRAEWGGEFQEMEEAEAKLMIIIPASLAGIFMLLYMAFNSAIDACLVLFNVVALSLGGVWALYLTGTNFSISAAVGFVSIFGVGVMDGLLLVSYFNEMRAKGVPPREAILQGAERRVRPMMMTDLTAIFGLLPAAFATRIGSQTQKPLAIVVVGGMIATLLMTRYLVPVLYSFFAHRQPKSGGGLAH
jgi:cobalt-zinc-cadmium resistance protein CzcA